jgi:superfamily II DNA/RNA helicase
MLDANRGTNYIDRCDYLVFDELHRMLDEGHVDELNVIHRRSLAPDRKHHTRLVYSSQFSIYERMFSKDFLDSQHTIVNMMPLTVAENNFRNVAQFVEIVLRDEDKRHEMAKFLEKIWRNKTFAKGLKVLIFVDKAPPQSFFTKTQERLPSSAPKMLNFTTIQSEETQSATVKQFNSKRSNQILVTRNCDTNLLGGDVWFMRGIYFI